MPTKTAKIPRHKTPRSRPYVLTPRRATKGQKTLLADYVKAMPLTKKTADAKKFHGKQGAYKFLKRHRSLARRLRVIPLATHAA